MDALTYMNQNGVTFWGSNPIPNSDDNDPIPEWKRYGYLLGGDHKYSMDEVIHYVCSNYRYYNGKYTNV